MRRFLVNDEYRDCLCAFGIHNRNPSQNWKIPSPSGRISVRRSRSTAEDGEERRELLLARRVQRVVDVDVAHGREAHRVHEVLGGRGAACSTQNVHACDPSGIPDSSPLNPSTAQPTN